MGRPMRTERRDRLRLRNSEGKSTVRSRGWIRPESWNARLLWPSKNMVIAVAPVRRSSTATVRCQAGSAMQPCFRCRCDTVPDGKIPTVPPCVSHFRAARRYEVLRWVALVPPRTSTGRIKGLISGMRWSSRLASRRKSGRTWVMMSPMISPSATPKGWLATTTSGPAVGILARSSDGRS